MEVVRNTQKYHEIVKQGHQRHIEDKTIHDDGIFDRLYAKQLFPEQNDRKCYQQLRKIAESKCCGLIGLAVKSQVLAVARNHTYQPLERKDEAQYERKAKDPE